MVTHAAAGANSIRLLRSALSQQPQELGRIEPVAAHHGAIEQQYRHVEPMAPVELGVAIDVDDFDRRQRDAAAQSLELREHFLTQLTARSLHECQLHMTPFRSLPARALPHFR